MDDRDAGAAIGDVTRHLHANLQRPHRRLADDPAHPHSHAACGDLADAYIEEHCGDCGRRWVSVGIRIQQEVQRHVWGWAGWIQAGAGFLRGAEWTDSVRP